MSCAGERSRTKVCGGVRFLGLGSRTLRLRSGQASTPGYWSDVPSRSTGLGAGRGSDLRFVICGDRRPWRGAWRYRVGLAGDAGWLWMLVGRSTPPYGPARCGLCLPLETHSGAAPHPRLSPDWSSSDLRCRAPGRGAEPRFVVVFVSWGWVRVRTTPGYWSGATSVAPECASPFVVIDVRGAALGVTAWASRAMLVGCGCSWAARRHPTGLRVVACVCRSKRILARPLTPASPRIGVLLISDVVRRGEEPNKVCGGDRFLGLGSSTNHPRLLQWRHSVAPDPCGRRE
jgi:hypothetical protein